MQTLHVQIYCRPRAAYRAADRISIKDTHDELKPVASDFDLLLKPHPPKSEDISKFISDCLPNTEAIDRTCTGQSYQIFAQ